MQTHDSLSAIQTQDHSQRSKDLVLNFVSAPYLLGVFFLTLVKCWPQSDGVRNPGPSYTDSRSMSQLLVTGFDLEFQVNLMYIPFTTVGFYKSFANNDLMKTMCRTRLFLTSNIENKHSLHVGAL